MRVMLLGESVHINQSFGSSRLNLAYEGLLLGMRKGGRKETLMKLHPTHRTKLHPANQTFIDNTTVDNFIICFVGKDNLTPRRSSSSVRGCKETLMKLHPTH
jgi:hypothetical protein